MDRAERSLHLELPARPESVTEGRRAAAQLAVAVGADRPAVELAVAEAVGNAVLHAYPEGPPGTVTIIARPDGPNLAIVIRDDGVGMRPDPTRAGLGFGLPLIAQVSTALAITDAPTGGTEIRMRFPLDAQESARRKD
jgi:anti-sigma regulatory factor (Ser/Thr protein kinase)